MFANKIMLRHAQELEVSTEAFGLRQLLDSVHELIELLDSNVVLDM
jgi:hypothetical protein